MFATRSESSNSAKDPGNGRNLLNAYVCCQALSGSICRPGEPSPHPAHRRRPTLSDNLCRSPSKLDCLKQSSSSARKLIVPPPISWESRGATPQLQDKRQVYLRTKVRCTSSAGARTRSGNQLPTPFE